VPAQKPFPGIHSTGTWRVSFSRINTRFIHGAFG